LVVVMVDVWVADLVVDSVVALVVVLDAESVVV